MAFRPGEYAPHLTSRACGLLFAGAQELFKYKRDEGGFTGWLATRLPHFPQSSAYQAIEIFKGVSEEMILNFGNIRPGALAEVAKAEPDVQALIAERIEAGEIFTAAKVKEIRKEAAREAAQQLAGRPPLNDLQPAKFIFA